MRAGLTLGLLCSAGGLGAQAVPPVGQVPNVSPPTAGEILRTPPAPPTAPTVSVRSRGAMVAGPCPEGIANSPLRMALKGVDFTAPGGAPLPPQIAALLAGVGAGLDGSERPLADVCTLRDAATAALARGRYVAVVQVPEQTLGDGRLKLTVVTARIAELRVRGDPGRSQGRLEALLGRLKALDPLNEADAERVLLLASDIPGISVNLELRPSPTGRPGEVIGEVAIERTAGSLLFNAVNTGSQQIGRWSGLVRGELFGLTGMADRSFVALFSTADFKEQQVVQGGHEFGIGSKGFRVGATATYAWTSPSIDNAGAGFDLASRSLLMQFQASYPVLRSTNRNIRMAAGLDYTDQRVRAGILPINLDKLRTLFLRADGEFQERPVLGLAPAWRVGGTLELRKGIAALGATRPGQISGTAVPTRFEGDGQAFVVRGGVNGEARLRFGPASPYAVTFAGDVRGQWTNKPLLAFDEFAVGNLTMGRGYDPGATSGDRAIGASGELRVGKPQPQGRNDLALEALGFFDWVKIRNLDSTNFERDRTLKSVGGGVRATWGARTRLDVTYARPLDKALEIDNDRAPARVLVSLTVRALPWR
ncbi:ShlB/FhaC/HecB family hemolysin secretion/activation protein [Sandaracinobacteroides saxicola]|uniref:ShlB/FhaC/HecB family hemolysin secretion/activation protein n=1 Tax=Sandaracinobacteroides saxicola TaxID=2759707 RepID=A0A7G5IJ02_9SPHN|nr:ShlB/FhaC/HecB family hemolysin secretion/activation protein [Sandaracinobacteroides saxicola]QMW23344.1 ShlB/FhaC/HecB family hemolysin secretion/activation protein [Sandaracinobacteroides saxicola]